MKQGTWVRVVTATHVVADLANADVPWACHVDVQQPGNPQTYVAVRDDAERGPSELERATDVTVLRVFIPEGSNADFAWPGFRDSRTLEEGESLHFARRKNSLELEVEIEDATATKSFSAMRGIARGDIQCGDSGSPLFDADWKIVGMIANEKENRKDGGLFVTAETIQLVLRSAAIEPNLPDVDAVRFKYREEEWSHSKGGLLFGIAEIQPDLAVYKPLGLARFGGYIEGHITNFTWPLVGIRSGIRAVAAYDLFAGYQENTKGYFEVVTSTGFSLFQRFGAWDSAGFLRWSPSIFHWETISKPEIIMTGFSAGYRLTRGSWGGGFDIRWLRHSGRSDFVPSLFFAW